MTNTLPKEVETTIETWKVELSGLIFNMVNHRPDKRIGFIPGYGDIVKFVADELAVAEARGYKAGFEAEKRLTLSHQKDIVIGYENIEKNGLFEWDRTDINTKQLLENMKKGNKYEHYKDRTTRR